jgi:hypothetical protein
MIFRLSLDRLLLGFEFRSKSWLKLLALVLALLAKAIVADKSNALMILFDI